MTLFKLSFHNNFTKIVYKLRWVCNILNFTPLYTAHSVIIVWTNFDVYCTCNILTFSMYWFLLSIFIIPYFRSLSRERSSKILLNMCVSMLLMNVAFLMMAETTMSRSYGLCVAIAILLHYFLLTSLMWMLTEAINMYHALITVFTTYTSQFILKRCLVAWGKYSWCSSSLL